MWLGGKVQGGLERPLSNRFEVALNGSEFAPPAPPQQVAVTLLQRGAGQHDVSFFRNPLLDLLVNGGEPGSAIGIGERDALVHFFFVGGGVKLVGVDKIPAQLLGEQAADSCLPGAGRPHHHDNHADSALMPAQQENDVERDKHSDDELQHKHAALVELRAHDPVEFARRLQLLVDQRLVVVDADLGGDDSVDARVVCVADEFYSVFGAFGQIHDVKAKAVHAAGAAGQSPAREKTFVALKRAVDVGEEVGEDLVVVTKLEQLRVL